MATTDSTTGTLLGDRYLLTRPLGAGASATVYLAEDRSLRREVAVKVLRAGLSSDHGFQRRFRAEAVAAAGLNHPHVLSVFDWGEAHGEAWLVTEYLAGGSLRDLLDQRGRLPIEQVVSIGSQAADGLAYAHSSGFVHRDVKPANLLFDDAGRVRIADFGVARALAEAAWTEPTGGLIGTVRYSSPEQAQGLAVDGKADVYSLAIVLYECATGEVPFTSDSQVATLKARVGAALPPNPALGPLAAVLQAAAAPDPARRLDSATFAARLEELARTLPDPLPLRSPKPMGTVGFRAPTPEELTGQHRAVAPPRGPEAVAAMPLAVPTEHVAAPPESDLTQVGAPVIADATVVGASLSSPETAPARRRRRWPVVVVVALALIAGGIAAGVIATRSTPPPTIVVPRVIGLPVDQVRATLARHHVGLQIDKRVLSKTVAVNGVTAQHPVPGASIAQGATVQVVVSAGPPPVAIPTVVGLSCLNAAHALAVEGFHPSCPPSLAAYSTSVEAGRSIAVFYGNAANPSSAPYGANLAVQLSKGRPPIPIPDVIGRPGTPAVATLQRAGFVVKVAYAFSHTVHAGNVLTTRPGPQVPLRPGGTVTVVVSNGAPVVIPSLTGLSLNAAESLLIKDGLTVLGFHGPKNSHHWTTRPAAGSVVTKGTSVTLFAPK